MRDQVRERRCRAVPAVAAAAGPAVAGAAAPRLIIAGFGDVQLVAKPEGVPLDAPAGITIVGRGDPGMTGRETVTLRLLLPPLDHLPPVPGDGAGVVLHQHPAQHVHRGQLPQPRRGGRVADRVQQRVPVPGIRDGQLILLRLRGRGPPGGHRRAIAAGPVRHADPLPQPVRIRGGQHLQRRRTLSPASSSRFSAATAATTCVESTAASRPP